MREEFHGVIVARFWDEFRGASDAVVRLAAYLCTGRHNQNVPGLAVLSMATIADDLGWSTEKARATWAELLRFKPGFAEYDEATRVVRVPNVPRLGHKPNYQAIRGWWRRWRMIPECALKYAHVNSLEAALALPDLRTEVISNIWAETFATVGTSINAAMDNSIDDAMDEPIHGPSHGGSGSGSSLQEATQSPEASSPRARAPRRLGTAPAEAQGQLIPIGDARPTERIRVAEVSPHARFVSLWTELFAAATGDPYDWTDKRQFKHVQAAGAKPGGFVEAERRARIYLGPSCPPWMARGGRDLAGFVQHWNKLAGPDQPNPRDPRVGHVAVTGRETYRDGTVEDF